MEGLVNSLRVGGTTLVGEKSNNGPARKQCCWRHQRAQGGGVGWEVREPPTPIPPPEDKQGWRRKVKEKMINLTYFCYKKNLFLLLGIEPGVPLMIISLDLSATQAQPSN